MNKQIDSRVVVDIINKHIGKENAIKAEWIIEQYKYITNEDILDVQVRRSVRKARLAKIPILSGGSGFYMPATEEEGIKCVDRNIDKRALKILALKKPMKKSIKDYFRKERQLSLAEV